MKRDVEVIFGPATANLALFERGDVEGVLLPEPTATRLVARGARQIAHLGELWQKANNTNVPTFLVGLAARRRWVEDNRDTATRIARLFTLANRSIHDRPALLIEQRPNWACRKPKSKRSACCRNAWPTPIRQVGISHCLI